MVLAHPAPEGLLAAVDRAANVVLVRPDDAADGGIEAAAGALRRAAGISSPYVLVAADPLAGVAAGWQAMWEIPREASREQRSDEEFELRAAEALGAWRAGRFELPDYYLVLAERTPPHQEHPPDFYLGPLRSVRPHRVAVAAAAEPTEQAAEVLTVLGSLRHGRWWPSLDEIFRTARGFYPGALAESGSGLASGRPALPDPRTGVHVNFVGSRDHFRVRAGRAASVWLCGLLQMASCWLLARGRPVLCLPAWRSGRVSVAVMVRSASATNRVGLPVGMVTPDARGSLDFRVWLLFSEL